MEPDFFFLPGVVSASFCAQRANAQRTLNKVLRRTLRDAAQGVRGSPKHTRTLDLFDDAVVRESVRLAAVAMPFVVASMASTASTGATGDAPWRCEQERERLWRSVRAVCRAFNETMLRAEATLYQAWFASLPAQIRQTSQVVFCGQNRSGWLVAVALLQKRVNRRPQEWKREVEQTYITYHQCVRVRSAKGRTDVAFLFETVCAQLAARGLYVELPSWETRRWNELQ